MTEKYSTAMCYLHLWPSAAPDCARSPVRYSKILLHLHRELSTNKLAPFVGFKNGSCSFLGKKYVANVNFGESNIESKELCCNIQCSVGFMTQHQQTKNLSIAKCKTFWQQKNEIRKLSVVSNGQSCLPKSSVARVVSPLLLALPSPITSGKQKISDTKYLLENYKIIYALYGQSRWTGHAGEEY